MCVLESKCIPKAELFFLSFMEHLISQSVFYCSKHLPPLIDPYIDHAKLNRQRRRRGFRQHSSPDSQEWSEGGEYAKCSLFKRFYILLFNYF